MADRLRADRFGVLAEIDGGVRIDGADVYHHRNAMFDLLDDDLGDFLTLLWRQRRSLAVRTQNKERMHAASDKPIGQLAHEFFIDSAVFQKHRRTGKHDPSNLIHHRNLLVAAASSSMSIENEGSKKDFSLSVEMPILENRLAGESLNFITQYSTAPILQLSISLSPRRRFHRRP